MAKAITGEGFIRQQFSGKLTGKWLKAIFSYYRNPTAHEPRILKDVTEAEVPTISLLHRKLDEAQRTPLKQ